MKTKINRIIEKHIISGDYKEAYDEIESNIKSFDFQSLPNIDAIHMYRFLMYAVSRNETADIHLSICNYLNYMNPIITDNDSLIKWHLVRAFEISHDKNVLKNWIFGVYSGNPDCPFSEEELNYYRSFLEKDEIALKIERIRKEEESKKFALFAADLHWIRGDADDPRDLCLHGKAAAKIGDRTLEFDECAVSATALYLLKSLSEDHIIFKESVQMLPCCGFYIIPNGDLSAVTISGCNSGVDWSVIHCGDNVKLILEDGYEVEVPLDEYKEEVFRFADMIEDFYFSCSPKVFSDQWDEDVYNAFWNEWRRRRNREQTKSAC